MTYDWDGRRTKRLRLAKMIGSALIAGIAVGMACYAPHARAQTFAMVTGKCQKLVVGKGDHTSDCQPKLLSTSYPDGRIGFWFLLPKSTILSISGQDLPKPSPDMGVVNIDRVVFLLGDNAAPPLNKPARGKCTYSNPNKPMTIKCQGIIDGVTKFIAVFKTDGKPPQ